MLAGCTIPVGQSITVAVKDARTQAAITAKASLIVRQGGVLLDSVTGPTIADRISINRPDGTYDLTIRAPGYAPEQRAGVVVTHSGKCQQNTVVLEVALQPVG
ncbi:MAG: hypothetical protein JWO05_3551 [Gemmatimonadetes bacterium]|nr:hypothetical protein [Gemmatimonadota bacterium]